MKQEKQNQQGLRDAHSFLPCNSYIPALPRIPTEKTLKGRTPAVLLMTHLMCEAIQLSCVLAFPYCSLKPSARCVLALFILLGCLRLKGMLEGSSKAADCTGWMFHQLCFQVTTLTG